jgi:hypothetical protein
MFWSPDFLFQQSQGLDRVLNDTENRLSIPSPCKISHLCKQKFSTVMWQAFLSTEHERTTLNAACWVWMNQTTRQRADDHENRQQGKPFWLQDSRSAYDRVDPSFPNNYFKNWQTNMWS